VSGSELPKVTVLLPVFNAEPFLREALDSIMAQSFSDFEILAIDDGSRDQSARILASYGDPRLRIIRHGANLGLVASLNEGLADAKGEYIARMDADDISLPARFDKQVRFLDSNPDIGLCGTWARRFGEDRRIMAGPAESAMIRCELLFQSAFVHPSVMMRRGALSDHSLTYRRSAHTEDIELWQRVVEAFPVANIPRILLKYRVHAASVTGNCKNIEESRNALRGIDRAALSRLGLSPTDDELTLHHLLRTADYAPLDDLERWLCKLKEANGRVNLYPSKEFDQTIARRWFHVCNVAKGWGAVKWPRMRISELSDGLQMSAVDVIKFAVRIH
jgi:glycosyltransferase involved in cell wall biosynthesis